MWSAQFHLCPWGPALAVGVNAGLEGTEHGFSSPLEGELEGAAAYQVRGPCSAAETPEAEEGWLLLREQSLRLVEICR